ncbi:MAG: chromosome segregation protein SMC [Deltaproteobacteria bacterium]|nr:chromosome segregation protein SMC [Deltaproteobacteria bacterium]
MRLKSLEMTGFKSFIDRTTVHFEDGITGIVGPNGCGKSNVVDAIRWVMGEQSAKHLRGSSMEDVIFNGTTTRPAMGMAEVLLTFDNSDGGAPATYSEYTEIQIGRRLYRSGESEYFINKTACRLRDVIDFFLGTGVGTKAYSIVEQGMIGSIIQSKPEDRRLFIEEAAGISKFKARKEAALRRVESTKANVERLTDIIAELSRQMNSLHRQAKKAERYQRIAEELKGRELTLAATRYRKLRGDLERREKEEQRLREQEAGAEAELGQFESSLEGDRLALTQLERELQDVQQQLYATRNTISLHESSVQHKTQEIERLTATKVSAERDIVELEARLALLAERLAVVNEERVRADMEMATSQETTDRIDQENAALKTTRDTLQSDLETTRDRYHGVATQMSDGRARRESWQHRLDELLRRKQSLEEEVATFDRQLATLDRELAKQRKDLEGYRQVKLHLVSEAESLRVTLEQQQAEAKRAEETVAQLERNLQTATSRHASLVELTKNFDGFRDGVRAVLRQAHEGATLSGIVGAVSELLETEPRFERAVSAILGDKLQYVVVASPEVGVGAIDYLKREASGRGTFVPVGLRLSEEQRSFPTGDGIVGRLLDCVHMREEHQSIARYLFSDVVVVEDVPRALKLWSEGAAGTTYVTLEGDVVDAAGCVTGGSSDAGELLVSQKRRLGELEQEMTELRGKLSLAEVELEERRKRVAGIERQCQKMTADDHTEAIRVVSLEHDVGEIEARLIREREQHRRLTATVSSTVTESETINRELASLATFLEKAEEESRGYEQYMREREGRLTVVTSDLAVKETELLDAKVRLAHARERRQGIDRELEQQIDLKADAEVQLSRRRSDISQAEQAVATLQAEIVSLKEELGRAVQQATSCDQQLITLKERYESQAKVIQEQEAGLRALRSRHTESVKAAHEIQLHLTEVRSEVNHLLATIRERYHVELPAIEVEYARNDADYNVEQEMQEVEALKEKIDGIGAVNTDAIKEYEELSERHTFLSKQQVDLTTSLEALVQAIHRINRTSRKRFRETFDAVNEKFEVLFPKLFGGGRARLLLTDEENLLESGVEIMASPPGKKLQSITLLSGGEKALTSVALIFSIFLIKPSPFCLLDEVDAPLDDANIDRFNELIRGMIPHSQFILITHNKRTMELADLLYGVTMQEAGISRMVSVRLGQTQEPLSQPAVA